jgi:hypothetical protein
VSEGPAHDEAELAAWQAALARALLELDEPAAVRERLRAALPAAEQWITALDDRALAVAIDLVRRWSGC